MIPIRSLCPYLFSLQEHKKGSAWVFYGLFIRVWLLFSYLNNTAVC